MKLCRTTLLLGALASLASAAVPPTVIGRFDSQHLHSRSIRRQPFKLMHRQTAYNQTIYTGPTVYNASTPHTCEIMRQEIAGSVTEPEPTPDQKDDINQEEEQKILAQMMLDDPNLTLWDIFMIRAHKIGQKIKHTKDKFKLIVGETAHIIGGTLEWTIKFVAGFFKWMGQLFVHPKQWGHSIKDFFKKLGAGMKGLWHMMWHKPPKYTLEMIGGGIMLEITDKPDKFIAQTGLLLGGGFALIHGVMEGLEVIIPALPVAVGTAMQSALIFVHMLDDPIIILSTMLNVATKTTANNQNAMGGNGTSTSTSATATLIIPDGLGPDDKIPTLPTCMLPPSALAYELTYGRFCSITVDMAQLMVFGTDKQPEQLSQDELAEAQKKFHDFACCYGPTNYTPPGFENSTIWNNAPVTIHNCNELRGKYINVQ